MADLFALQQAALRNQQATQKLAGLDEQYERAKMLRDAEGPQINQYGNVSPLSVLANVVNKSRGRRDIRELEPERNLQRSIIAKGTGALEGNALRMALAKESRDETRLGIEQDELGLRKSKQKLAKEKQEADLAKNAGQAETWTNGKDNRAVVYDAENKPVFSDTGEPVTEGWYPKEKSYGGGYGGKRIGPTTIANITRDANQVRKVASTASRWEPRFIQLGGVETETLNKLIAKGSSADLLKFAASDELTQDARDAAQWWADWAMFYELPERHRLFGATLTNNEMASWKEATQVLRGMDTDESRKRIMKLTNELTRDVGTHASTLRKLRAGHENETGALDMLMSDSGYIFGEDGRYTWGQESPQTADSGQPGQPASREQLSVEKTKIYGQMIMKMTQEERAAFDTLEPDMKRSVLDDLYNQNYMMTE